MLEKNHCHLLYIIIRFSDNLCAILYKNHLPDKNAGESLQVLDAADNDYEGWEFYKILQILLHDNFKKNMISSTLEPMLLMVGMMKFHLL